ncbi:unnamed protein product [Somion occarium]|uniref:Uncharacterized protein n=1 Tax=Somion occarium TaxID=3059160 RepID=A0ABP1CV17_9APHY
MHTTTDALCFDLLFPSSSFRHQVNLSPHIADDRSHSLTDNGILSTSLIPRVPKTVIAQSHTVSFCRLFPKPSPAFFAYIVGLMKVVYTAVASAASISQSFILSSITPCLNFIHPSPLHIFLRTSLPAFPRVHCCLCRWIGISHSSSTAPTTNCSSYDLS